MFIVYAIRNEAAQFYIGHTNDLEVRLKRHNGELPSKSTAYTTKNRKGRWILIYTEKCDSRAEAIKREKQLKSYQGRKFLKNLDNQDK